MHEFFSDVLQPSLKELILHYLCKSNQTWHLISPAYLVFRTVGIFALGVIILVGDRVRAWFFLPNALLKISYSCLFVTPP